MIFEPIRKTQNNTGLILHLQTHTDALVPCGCPQTGWTRSSPCRCSCWLSSTAQRRCCPAPEGWCLCSWSSRTPPSPSPCRSPRRSAAPSPGTTWRRTRRTDVSEELLSFTHSSVLKATDFYTYFWASCPLQMLIFQTDCTLFHEATNQTVLGFLSI